MNGVAVKPLTVSFHEGGFLSKANSENRMGFWFQLDDQGRQQMGSPMGPINPQALNRYSYVQNNPLKYTDPSGHLGVSHGNNGNTYHLNHDEAVWLWNFMLHSVFTILGVIAATATGIGAALTALHNTLMGFGLGWGALIESYLLLGIHGAAFTTVGGLIAALTLAATAAGMALALADALYGYKGVDVFVAYGPAYILLLPPTIERQQGERWSQGTQDNPSSFIEHGSGQLFPNPASIQLSR